MNSKQKNIALVAVVVLGLFCCYRWGISKTLAVRNTYKNLLKEALTTKEFPKQRSMLLKKEMYFDSILTKMNLGSSSIENNLLLALNTEAHKYNIKVMDFSSPHLLITEGDGQQRTFPIVLEGNFTDLLKTIYALEYKNNFGEIVHATFTKKKNYRSKKAFLTATIFLRNIE